MPEAESELVAGYFTEYSGMRFAFFFLAEFAHLFFVAGLRGGAVLRRMGRPLLPGWMWFLIKVNAVIIVIMWIRWTLPRLRIDQVMSFAWKLLVPASLLAVALTGLAAVRWKLG